MDTDTIIQIIIAVVGSSSVWKIIDKIIDRKSADKLMIMGLGRDKIYFLCEKYIDRGNITEDEYEVLNAMYEPYIAMGGNGVAKHLMDKVNELPIVKEKKK